jgi:lipopolysaccharide transport system ATP-binding protein
MAAGNIITVENLGKRYSLSYLRDERYIALRDVLMEKATGLFRRASAKSKTNRASDFSSQSSSSDLLCSRTSKEEFWALNNVSFEVRESEVVGIIGRNGAGKSTLLKILSRITAPTEGRVHIKGRVASLLEVGTGFHPELTGRENIYLNGAILGMTRSEINKRFDEIIAFAEVEQFLDTPIKHYSSGMYVRLAFAVAAHLDPEILIIDEVLSVGDALFQKKCLGKMQSVSQSGRTVLFVSHNMAMVRALCDKALLLERGRISSIGPVLETIDKYINHSGDRLRFEPIAPQQHQINTGELWIDRLSLRDSEGRPISNVQVGQPISILLHFNVQAAVRGLRFGIGFNTPEGVRVATLHHTDNGDDLICLEPGPYQMSLAITNPLLAGKYLISVGVHRALGGWTVDYVPEALVFNVIDVSNTGVTHEGHNTGMIRVSGLWQMPERV